MKKTTLSLIYTLLIIVAGSVIFLVLHARINSHLFDYKFAIYDHEIDFLFHELDSKQFRVKHVYKSGERGAIYFVNYDTITNIGIIEATNFEEIFFKGTDISVIDEIEISQLTTYTSVVDKKFPVIQQALNTRKSDYLKISFEKPAQIEKEIKNKNYCYIKGHFRYLAFGNSQNCSIITFRKDFRNEILVTKYNGKLYFIFQTIAGKSLLDIINPSLLQEKQVASARL